MSSTPQKSGFPRAQRHAKPSLMCLCQQEYCKTKSGACERLFSHWRPEPQAGSQLQQLHALTQHFVRGFDHSKSMMSFQKSTRLRPVSTGPHQIIAEPAKTRWWIKPHDMAGRTRCIGWAQHCQHCPEKSSESTTIAVHTVHAAADRLVHYRLVLRCRNNNALLLCCTLDTSQLIPSAMPVPVWLLTCNTLWGLLVTALSPRLLATSSVLCAV